jgi:long-chain fatty acid transport protein
MARVRSIEARGNRAVLTPRGDRVIPADNMDSGHRSLPPRARAEYGGALFSRAFATAVVVACTLSVTSAEAAGLFSTDRGVRPLGRGGAFVAGTDDLHGVWYNPAGLTDAGTSLLVDFSWINFSAEYTRRAQVVDAGGTVRQVDFPEVKAVSPFVPIPTLAASYNFGKNKELTIAAALHAPYTALPDYPVTVQGEPAPSRYSLISLEGSALLVTGAYIAYKPTPKFRVGAGLQALVGKFASRVMFSASPPDRLISAPEDPNYDSLSQLNAGPIISPSATFGMIASPIEMLRLGVSAQLPHWINSPASVEVRLPTAAPFDRARHEGTDATVRFRLPPIIRAGVEVRPNIGENARLRAELSYVREFWSIHDSIEIEPENIRLYDITGFPSPFSVATISIPRGFQDSNSFRLGAEYSLKNLIRDYWIDLRAGASYETSAIPPEWVSPLTYDANKFVPSLGGSVHVGEHWRMDAVAAVAFLGSQNVDPGEAQVPRVNPVRGNPTATEAINGGEYHARAIILGVGVNYKF